MARRAQISDDEYAKLVQKVADMGYDIRRLRKVPHNAPQ
jgi:apolipoprotein D and lipocalin family protein